MIDSRREQAQNELGMNFEQEDIKRQIALENEKKRQQEKEEKRQALMNLPSYRMMDKTARYFDCYFLDPILGFFLPGIADFLTSILALPFIYYSLFIVKSVPLTLAVIANTLKDALIGMIPFFIGDILDVFNRSYVENLKLITGYINDDKYVIEEVNRKAIWSAIFIVILCIIIYYMVSFVIWIGESISSLF